jgi:hypothetical protein
MRMFAVPRPKFEQHVAGLETLKYSLMTTATPAGEKRAAAGL